MFVIAGLAEINQHDNNHKEREYKRGRSQANKSGYLSRQYPT
jgi:hypothetical protein